MENEMNISLEEVLSRVDHSLLKQTATWNEIKVILDDAMEYGAASACIPPCYVKRAREYVGDRLKICTVIGFPNGNTTTASKVFETIDAVRAGADEIDMVINVSFAKERDTQAGSLSEPTIRYCPLNSLSCASSFTCFQISWGIQRYSMAAKVRFRPGARFLAISAASMGMVPEPQKGSQKYSLPR